MSTPAHRPTAAGARRVLSPLLAALRALTPLGRGVVVTGIGAAVLASRFHWQEFSQLAAVASGLVLLALLWQVLPGAPVGSLRLRQQRTVEGSAPGTAVIEVHTGAVPMLAPRVVVPVGESHVQLRLPFLGPYSSLTEDVDLPSMRRGVHAVGPVTYEKTDPVGLVSRRIETGGALDLFVAPQVTDLPVFAGGMTNDLDGATSQQLSMSDLAFHALREYVPGDDLRHVHWRSSAKAGQLLVRQYHESRRGHVTVLLDAALSSYPRHRDFELATSLATSIALRAVRDDFDTYLGCGPHVVHGRDAVAVTDAACRFVAVADDDHLSSASAAADAITGTGLVVQVTGAARDLVSLDSAAALFGRGADWIVVRADSRSEGQLRDNGVLRELVVPELSRLGDLMTRGMR